MDALPPRARADCRAAQPSLPRATGRGALPDLQSSSVLQLLRFPTSDCAGGRGELSSLFFTQVGTEPGERRLKLKQREGGPEAAGRAPARKLRRRREECPAGLAPQPDGIPAPRSLAETRTTRRAEPAPSCCEPQRFFLLKIKFKMRRRVVTLGQPVPGRCCPLGFTRPKSSVCPLPWPAERPAAWPPGRHKGAHHHLVQSGQGRWALWFPKLPAQRTETSAVSTAALARMEKTKSQHRNFQKPVSALPDQLQHARASH